MNDEEENLIDEEKDPAPIDIDGDEEGSIFPPEEPLEDPEYEGEYDPDSQYH